MYMTFYTLESLLTNKNLSWNCKSNKLYQMHLCRYFKYHEDVLLCFKNITSSVSADIRTTHRTRTTSYWRGSMCWFVHLTSSFSRDWSYQQHCSIRIQPIQIYSLPWWTAYFSSYLINLSSRKTVMYEGSYENRRSQNFPKIKEEYFRIL